jgi:DMSO reductase iron-sulfur subunit
MQRAFTLDIDKCTGCQACEVACSVENELPPGTSWRSVETFNARHHPGLPAFHLSLACNHCVDAPCMEHCPALAYSKDDDTGAIVLDQSRCIGCKYCTWACPYDAPRYDATAGVVSKCTFCSHRLKEGQRPACVEQCPTGALQIAELQTAAGESKSLGFPQTDARPAVRFLSPRKAGEPAASTPPAGAVPGGIDGPEPSKIALGSEWPLVVFTLLCALLVGLMAAPGASERMDAFVFIALAALGAGFSTMHLGRRLRAYRAVANWRRSWLSREILLFSAFSGLSVLHLLTAWFDRVTGALSVVTGFALLFAMDRVYRVTRTPGLWRHSAQVLLTGLLVLAIAAGWFFMFTAVAALKAGLYVYRKRVVPTVWLWFPRVVVGLLGPSAAWLTGGPEWTVWAAVALGEVVDRCEFYRELDVPTPRKQMATDLAALLIRQREVENRGVDGDDPSRRVVEPNVDSITVP